MPDHRRQLARALERLVQRAAHRGPGSLRAARAPALQATLTAPSERQRVRSGSPFEKTIGFSRAIRAGNRVLVSGTAPIWPDGTVDPDPYVQAKRCFEIIEAAIREAGASPDQVVRTRMYLTDAAFAQ
ncbi:MAG: Rid family hydrolase, partial [Thermoanaerobaculales bacterium]